MIELKNRGEANTSLARWGRHAALHPWRVIATWLVAAVIVAVLSTQFGAKYTSSFSIPHSETERTLSILKSEFPQQAGDTATVVFQTHGKALNDPAVTRQLESVVQQVKTLPHVAGVVTPADNPVQVSPNGQIAFVTVAYDTDAMNIKESDVQKLFHIADGASNADVTFEVGGQVARMGEVEVGGKSEIIGIVLAMIVMLAMFGSIIAMGLPIITALIGVGAATLLLPLFAHMFTFSNTITSAFLSMLGLGVGIDYALLIVNRYRDNMLHGMDHISSVGSAINTAGRSVIFAGSTVAIGLLGLTVIGLPFVTGMGVTGAVVVLMSILVGIFLMPALLGLVGRHILRWKIPGLGNESTTKDTFWFRWGRAVMAKPLLTVVLALAALLAIASPYLDQRLGLSDAGSNPTSYHTRRAYDLMQAGFGPGSNGPFIIAIDGDQTLDVQKLQAVSAAIQKTEGVAFASPAMPGSSGKAALIQVVPNSGPQDPKTEDLIKTLRKQTLPQALAGTNLRASLGGSTAANIDLSEKISKRMPLFYAIVILLSLVLLTMVFQSVLVPIKAALTTLLSVFTASGAVVAVFQWGWMKGILGLESTGPVESFLPMILFGVLFGLSMDYEVFLLTRVHEEHAHGQSAREAMLDGVGFSGKVVAAAGAIMGAVFLSFALGDLRMLKMLGFGLGFAILVDAFITRLILVPAIMRLLDESAWWFPASLKRVIPNLNVE